MTLKQIIKIIPSLVKYNLRIIFAGKFIWFFLAALAFFGFFMFQSAWDRTDMNDGVIYSLMFFPSLLLVFYPAVFGIQNDEENRILEILFGIPNYRYKVWGIRLLIIYVAILFILILFAYISTFLMYPVSEVLMALQLMFPVVFIGNLAFMLSTVTRSGNGTAVSTIMIASIMSILVSSGAISDMTFDIFMNPYEMPNGAHPSIWATTVLKNRLFLFIGAIVMFMIGLINLQKREKFV